MKYSSEIQLANDRLQQEFLTLNQHWHQHSLSRAKYNKFLLWGTAATLVWFIGSPLIRRSYFLFNLVSKPPIH